MNFLSKDHEKEEIPNHLLTNNGEQTWISNRVDEAILEENTEFAFVKKSEDDSEKKQKEDY